MSQEDGPVWEPWIRENVARVRRLLPLVRQLAGEPERAELEPHVIGEMQALCQRLQRAAASRSLAHLAHVATAMTQLLTGRDPEASRCSPRHIALIAETCGFVEQGLEMVAREKNDQRLAVVAANLQAAILELAQQGTDCKREKTPLLVISLELRTAFVQECEQLLMHAEQEYVLWDFIAVNHQRVADLCRLLHRLQQNFALYECRDFERLCWALESTLNRYLQGEFFRTEYPERVFLRCIAAMREGLACCGSSAQLVVADIQDHLQSVQALIRQPLGALLVEAGLVDSRSVDKALALQRCSRSEPPLLGEVLVAMGEISREQVQQMLTMQQRQLDMMPTAANDHRCTAAVHSPLPLFPREVKINEQTLVRMVSLVRQMANLSLPAPLVPLVDELQRLTRSCALEAAAGLLLYCQRLVDDDAALLDKQIHFQAQGLEIVQEELDLGLCTELLAPLLRNAVVHGVEATVLRQLAGKKRQGRLSLSVLRQGNELWISVEDDGGGFDWQYIAAYCLQHGVLGREELQRTSDKELLHLFLNSHDRLPTPPPPEGTNRCTGLAMVHKRLRDMNGTMDIWSRPRHGSRVTLRIARSL